MELLEAVTPPATGQHDSTCPFCAGTDKCESKGYNTKHGALKDEKELGKNLAKRGQITSDKEVGAVYPTEGGDDDHDGWIVTPNILEEFAVEIKPTPHHLIPGNAAMEPSSLEEWTCKKHGLLKEDVGYNIDCAENGIWLPHLPHIHWTRMFDKAKGLRFSDVFGKWSALSDLRKKAVGYLIMSETWLQMHYTDHDDPYVHVDNETTYDSEAKERCNLLGDLMMAFWAPKCPAAEDETDKKFHPPYGIINRINLQSTFMRQRITGRPTFWESWVSQLAQDFSEDLKQDRLPLRKRMLISKKS